MNDSQLDLSTGINIRTDDDCELPFDDDFCFYYSKSYTFGSSKTRFGFDDINDCIVGQDDCKVTILYDYTVCYQLNGDLIISLGEPDLLSWSTIVETIRFVKVGR